MNDHLFGKELVILFAASAFHKLSSIYVFSYFPFGFEGRIWDLIVSVPDHCLSFYLGQLLFLLYINDLALEINKSLLDFFADDTTLTVTGTFVEKIAEDLNHDIELIRTWCKKNKMSINISKTKAMFLSSLLRQALIQQNPPNLKIENELIQLSEKEKLLGSNSR